MLVAEADIHLKPRTVCLFLYRMGTTWRCTHATVRHRQNSALEFKSMMGIADGLMVRTPCYHLSFDPMPATGIPRMSIHPDERTFILPCRLSINTIYRVTPGAYDNDKRIFGRERGRDAWRVAYEDGSDGVVILHYDRKYFLLDAGAEWSPSGRYTINTSRRSFRDALSSALGLVAGAGDWYLAERRSDGTRDNYDPDNDQLRKRVEQEVLDEFIKDLRPAPNNG